MRIDSLYILGKFFNNVSPDSVRFGRTCPANLSFWFCPVRKFVCQVQLSPTFSYQNFKKRNYFEILWKTLMQKWLVSHWKLPCLQWFLGWKLLQWQQLQSSKLAWLFWPFEPNLELEQSNLFMGIGNFLGLAGSVVRGEYIVENLKLCHDHHKNCPKGKHFFIYHIVASRSTCYYSENQKIRFFVF